MSQTPPSSPLVPSPCLSPPPRFRRPCRKVFRGGRKSLPGRSGGALGAVTVQLVQQRPRRDAKPLGRRGLVASQLAQRRQDQAPLHLLQRQPAVALRRGRGGLA